MGRGPSGLQRSILLAALDGLRERARMALQAADERARAAWLEDHGRGDAVYPEIKVESFNLPVRRSARGLEYFEASTLPNYNAVSATISRAVHRLANARRGLVTVALSPEGSWLPSRRAEVRLTETGLVMADALETAIRRTNGTVVPQGPVCAIFIAGIPGTIAAPLAFDLEEYLF